MKDNFATCLKLTLAYEGGFVNDPRDPGGATNHGITIGTLKHLAIDVDGDGDSDVADLKALRPADLEYVYRGFYWNPVQGDCLPRGLDLVTFDASVMSGVARGAKWLQQAVGAEPDGAIGPRSLQAVLAVSSVQATIHRACDARLAFCKVARNSKTGAALWPTYGKGWQARIDKVRVAALSMV